MKKTINLITIIALLFSFVGCSKELKIEKNLWKKGGDWEITKYMSYYGSFNPSINAGNNPSPEYLYYCGTFHFNKNKTGQETINIDGENYSFSFSYSNTENTMTIIEYGVAVVYDLEWSKDYIVLNRENNTTDSDGYQEVDSENIILKKKY